ncbi:hypothetical protein T439DRAFT_149775 [Meredithblackwellia eburnea MCA 4105]
MSQHTDPTLSDDDLMSTGEHQSPSNNYQPQSRRGSISSHGSRSTSRIREQVPSHVNDGTLTSSNEQSVANQEERRVPLNSMIRLSPVLVMILTVQKNRVSSRDFVKNLLSA